MKNLINKKNLFNYILLGFLMCLVQLGWAQNYSEDLDNEDTSVTELNGTEVSPQLFSSFFNTEPNSKLATIQGNAVFIRQIGESNLVAASVVSNASEINISQNGDLNNVNLEYNVNKVVSDLTQNGNSNNIKDYVINPNADISLDLIQNGDNLNFQRFGSNDISKNIKFTQTEASPTIIIRSFD